jgi:hypothetical protein
MNTVVISGDGIADNEFAQIGGPGVEGTLMSFGPDPRNNPNAKEVVAEFKAKNFDPEAYTLLLRRRPDHQAGGGEGQVARSEEDRGSHAFGHAVPYRDRRHRL